MEWIGLQDPSSLPIILVLPALPAHLKFELVVVAISPAAERRGNRYGDESVYKRVRESSLSAQSG